MTKEELIEKMVDKLRYVYIQAEVSRVSMDRDMNEIIDTVLDYALSEIDENVVKVIENLKVKK